MPKRTTRPRTPPNLSRIEEAVLNLMRLERYTCSRCEGTGFVAEAHGLFDLSCSRCDGRGWVTKRP